MPLKRSKFWEWLHTCPLENWAELHDDNEYIVIQFNKSDNENSCPDKLEPERLPKTSIEKLQQKYGRD